MDSATYTQVVIAKRSSGRDIAVVFTWRDHGYAHPCHCQSTCSLTQPGVRAREFLLSTN